MELTLEFIREALTRTDSLPTDDSGLTPAGVLLLLYPKDGELCVLLNKRTSRVEHHKGEISFPGGSQDPEDATILDTALREAFEEMGIQGEHVEVLCQLDQVTTRSGFAITPFVGIIPPSYPFKASGIEVAEVLEVPLSTLLAPATRRQEARAWTNGATQEHAYAYGEHLIWGATARMLTQFLGLIDPNVR